MSIKIDLNNATPCVFNRKGKMKFGIRTDDKFVWITQVLGLAGIETICMNIENPTDVTVLKMGTSEGALVKLGLGGYSLKIAKAWLDAK